MKKTTTQTAPPSQAQPDSHQVSPNDPPAAALPTTIPMPTQPRDDMQDAYAGHPVVAICTRHGIVVAARAPGTVAPPSGRPGRDVDGLLSVGAGGANAESVAMVSGGVACAASSGRAALARELVRRARLACFRHALHRRATLSPAAAAALLEGEVGVGAGGAGAVCSVLASVGGGGEEAGGYRLVQVDPRGGARDVQVAVLGRGADRGAAYIADMARQRLAEERRLTDAEGLAVAVLVGVPAGRPIRHLEPGERIDIVLLTRDERTGLPRIRVRSQEDMMKIVERVLVVARSPFKQFSAWEGADDKMCRF